MVSFTFEGVGLLIKSDEHATDIHHFFNY